ncbi:unnamed protein product [Pleuronectes platessa]|uniref:Uncharacterized protein n=1 Tax=Pleuronectes platessa TaxID=8262 RepID=A0A9N7UY75_PLEPL|nr:unnamed protein product [Pleuronectes platessa]
MKSIKKKRAVLEGEEEEDGGGRRRAAARPYVWSLDRPPNGFTREHKEKVARDEQCRRGTGSGLQSGKCGGVLRKVLKERRGGFSANSSFSPAWSRLHGVQIVHQLKEATLSTAGILATELRGSGR